MTGCKTWLKKKLELVNGDILFDDLALLGRENRYTRKQLRRAASDLGVLQKQSEIGRRGEVWKLPLTADAETENHQL